MKHVNTLCGENSDWGHIVSVTTGDIFLHTNYQALNSYVSCAKYHSREANQLLPRCISALLYHFQSLFSFITFVSFILRAVLLKGTN